MNPAFALLRLFAPDTTPLVEEDHERLALTAEPKRLSVPTCKELAAATSQLPAHDGLRISAVIDDREPLLLSFSNGAGDIPSFAGQLESEMVHVDEESSYRIRLEVIKGTESGALSIYSVEDFGRYLSRLSTPDQLALFAQLLKRGPLTCVLFDGVRIPSTNSIRFCSSTESDLQNGPAEHNRSRQRVLEKRAEACHFANAAQFPLVAEDFALKSTLEESEPDRLASPIEAIFRQLQFVLSLVSIADISEIRGNKVWYRVHGYRLVESSAEPENVSPELTDIYSRIYGWAYEEGSVTDRLGLARNILTLHWGPDGLGLTEAVVASIRSSYKIYLRENLEAYIEVKNRVVAFLLQQNERVGAVVGSFANSLKSNLAVFFSFVLSVVVVNTINTGRIENLFTRDISLICAFLIFLSLSYLYVSTRDLEAEKGRFNEDYDELKRSYSDLLDKQDLALLRQK